MQSVIAHLSSPRFMRNVNGTLAVLWLIAAVPICTTDLAHSIAMLTFMSAYAIVAAHWSAWQAGYVACKQESDADVQEVLDVLAESPPR